MNNDYSWDFGQIKDNIKTAELALKNKHYAVAELSLAQVAICIAEMKEKINNGI